MTRRRVQLHPAAEAEFREAFLWYFERSPMAADAFRLEIFLTVDGLVEQADMWPLAEEGFRKRVLRRFPYTLIYEIEEDLVTVFALAHQRRRPGYWRGR